jgi:uncharacterized protein YceK
MKLRINKKYLSIFLSLWLSGCATISTLTEPETKNKIYSGTIRHFDLKCGHGTCLDFPFSFILDTVLLPFTIPVTIYNYATAKPDEPSPKNNESPTPQNAPNT